MRELDLVASITRQLRRPGRGVVRGIGDDGAVLRWTGRDDLVVSTDFLIEDVHFRRATHPAEAVGWKALARGLSDIAAMGARARWCLVSLALAEWASRAWVKKFYDGLTRHGVPVVGGDLSRSDKVTVDVTAIGAVGRGKALRRDTAKPGDGIYVSGVLGGSALGLKLGKGRAWRRHLRPEPRLELGRHLAGRASACMDLSDGLSIDLYRMCAASGVAAVIDRPLPVFPGASLEEALHGGEDYELLFTAQEELRSYRGLALTRIGTVERGKAGSVEAFGSRIEPMGYDHFR